MSSFQLCQDGRKALRDSDEWFAAGDLGHVTEGGEIVICGRSKEMVIISGRNICPTDLEPASETVAGGFAPAAQ